MKKCVPLIALLVIAIFVMPTHADKPIPPPDQVEVINPQESPIPVTTNDQIDVNVVSEPGTPRDMNVTNIEPIPVTIIDGTVQKTIVSAYSEFFGGGEKTLITVPFDKQFILLDIIYYSAADQHGFTIKEDDTVILRSGFSGGVTGIYTHPLHFNSGIPFAPGAKIRVEANSGDITISGYLVDM